MVFGLVVPCHVQNIDFLSWRIIFVFVVSLQCGRTTTNQSLSSHKNAMCLCVDASVFVEGVLLTDRRN